VDEPIATYSARYRGRWEYLLYPDRLVARQAGGAEAQYVFELAHCSPYLDHGTAPLLRVDDFGAGGLVSYLFGFGCTLLPVALVAALVGLDINPLELSELTLLLAAGGLLAGCYAAYRLVNHFAFRHYVSVKSRRDGEVLVSIVSPLGGARPDFDLFVIAVTEQIEACQLGGRKPHEPDTRFRA
jgi:hypothetical protein